MAKSILAENESMAKKIYSFRFEPEIMKEVEKLAKKENRNLTNFIETALIKLVEDSKKSKKK